MTAFSIHCVPILHDNYAWLIQADHTPYVLVLDPGEEQPIIDYLKQHELIPVALMITHRHHDHVDGILAFLEHYPLPVYGPANEFIPGLTHPLTAMPSLSVHPAFPEFEVLDLPGHTEGHIAYLVADCLFCGDTLFAAGCGRLLGGTHEQLFNSLSRIKRFDPQTVIYCSHEYTAANLQFASAVEPDNLAVQKRIADVAELRAVGEATVPTQLAIELETNPFLRCHIPAVAQRAEQQTGQTLDSEQAVFTALRQWKDRF